MRHQATWINKDKTRLGLRNHNGNSDSIWLFNNRTEARAAKGMVDTWFVDDKRTDYINRVRFNLTAHGYRQAKR